MNEHMSKYTLYTTNGDMYNTNGDMYTTSGDMSVADWYNNYVITFEYRNCKIGSFSTPIKEAKKEESIWEGIW